MFAAGPSRLAMEDTRPFPHLTPPASRSNSQPARLRTQGPLSAHLVRCGSPGEGRLTERIPGVRPWGRRQLFMPGADRHFSSLPAGYHAEKLPIRWCGAVEAGAAIIQFCAVIMAVSPVFRQRSRATLQSRSTWLSWVRCRAFSATIASIAHDDCVQGPYG